MPAATDDAALCVFVADPADRPAADRRQTRLHRLDAGHAAEQPLADGGRATRFRAASA